MIPEQTLNLSGKVALVSGAGVGIGKAVALALGEAGAFVGIHYHSSKVGAEQLHIKNISFDVKRTGGPSGGMVFAIGVIELLTKKDILHGRHIAGTGTISPDGKVGPIGGINEKIMAAQKAGAEIFLAPAQNREEISHTPAGIKVVIVATLAQAIAAL